jgi:hypothetical protein
MRGEKSRRSRAAVCRMVRARLGRLYPLLSGLDLPSFLDFIVGNQFFDPAPNIIGVHVRVCE